MSLVLLSIGAVLFTVAVIFFAKICKHTTYYFDEPKEYDFKTKKPDA